jgi:superkiller protein 3
VFGALAAGVLAFGASWYLHIPVPTMIGSRDVKAASEIVTEAGPAPPSPDSAEAIFTKGEVAFAAGRWAEAASSYERAVAVRPDFEPAHTRWARALLNEHRVSEAIDRARQAIAQGPRAAEARAVLAIALDWSGQVDRSAQIAHEAVDLDRSSPAALGALAEASADQYRLLEADELLVRALKLAPDDADLYRVQGSIREARADYAGAVDAYRQAIELAPAWSYLYVSLGHALRAQGQHDGALAAFGRAVELAPEDARAEGGRGMVFYAREEYDPAIASFQRALELDPAYATAYAQLAWIHYARREYDRAEPLFGRAIELDHDGGRVAQYRHALGWIMLSARRSAEAKEQFTKALELSPNLQGARDGLKLLQGQGQGPTPARGR